MNRSLRIAAFVTALMVPMAPAVSATLANGNGQSCGDEIGTWHFVNNQTGGAAAGTLTATFSGGQVVTANASKVLPSVQHFYVTASGTLETASTGDLPGRLVLSDFSCDEGKKK